MSGDKYTLLNMLLDIDTIILDFFKVEFKIFI
jgi:hypothetical protein